MSEYTPMKSSFQYKIYIDKDQTEGVIFRRKTPQPQTDRTSDDIEVEAVSRTEGHPLTPPDVPTQTSRDPSRTHIHDQTCTGGGTVAHRRVRKYASTYTVRTPMHTYTCNGVVDYRFTHG